MAGATIDHLVAFTVFLAAILLFVGFYNEMNQTAILYQYHRFIATKCSDVLDSILLNPGSPSDWGVSDSETQKVTFFGLQDPEFQEYRLSPFSLMRILSPGTQLCNNLTWNVNGAYLILQSSECIDYRAVTGLLGINGSYDFQLSITPTLSIGISQVPSDHLRLEIQAYGTGFPLSNASLSYLMFWTDKNSSGSYPMLNCNFTSNALQTDLSGTTYVDFPSLNNETAFTFIAKGTTIGIEGIGYLSKGTLTGSIIPYLTSYDNGIANIMLVQNSPVSVGDLYFNASFYALPNNFVPILGKTIWGELDNFVPSQNLTIATDNQTGFVVIAYSDGINYGMIITPLGVNAIGLPITFGANTSGKSWVATDLRQVLIGPITYQAKLSLWSLQGYEVTG